MRLGFSTTTEVEKVGDETIVFVTFVEESHEPNVTIRVGMSSDVDTDVLDHVVECFPKMFRRYLDDIERQLRERDRIDDQLGWWHGRA